MAGEVEVKPHSSMDLCDWAIAGTSFAAGIFASHKVNQFGNDVGPLGKLFVPVFVTGTVLALHNSIRPWICRENEVISEIAQETINQS